MIIALLILVCLGLIGVGLTLVKLRELVADLEQVNGQALSLLGRIDAHTTPEPEPDPGTVAAQLQARLKRLESGRALLRQRLAAKGVKIPTPKVGKPQR